MMNHLPAVLTSLTLLAVLSISAYSLWEARQTQQALRQRRPALR